VLLQTGAAHVSTARINNLYRVILLGMDNVESSERRGNSWQRMPVALCSTNVKKFLLRYWRTQQILGAYLHKFTDVTGQKKLLLKIYGCDLRQTAICARLWL